MKAYGVLLFILSVIAVLALLCTVFPEEGIKAGPFTLQFPALADVLAGSEPEGESPEELLEKRMAAIREARMNDYLAYFENDPARIWFPDGDLTYFNSFFAALDDAGQRRMRIVHYGDSQIEEDRISRVLRDSLQTRFGGGGPGLLPVLDEYYNLSISEASSAAPRTSTEVSATLWISRLFSAEQPSTFSVLSGFELQVSIVRLSRPLTSSDLSELLLTFSVSSCVQPLTSSDVI